MIERDPYSSTGTDLGTYTVVTDTRDETLVNYDRIDDLVIDGGSSADEFDVDSTAASTVTTINAAGGNDAIDAGGPAQSMKRLLGSLAVDGGSGVNTLNLYDQSNADGIDPSFAQATSVTTRPTFVITAGSVTRDDALTYTTVATGEMSTATLVGSIAYSELSALNLYGGGSGNLFYIQGTAPTTPLTVNAMGSDHVVISNPTLTMDDIQGPIRINGSGSVPLDVTDFHNTVGHTYNFTANSESSTMTRTGAAPITYSGTSAIQLAAGSGDDTFDFEGINTFTAVYGGSGNNTFLLGSVLNNLDGLPNILRLDGTGPGPTGGSATLVVNDQANPLGATWTITDSALVRIRQATPDRIVTQIYFADFDSFALHAGSGDDTMTSSVDLPSPFALLIDGGAGNDTITDPGEGTTILGGPGNDSIIVTAATGSGVYVDGGDGSDDVTIYLGSLAGPVTVVDSGTSASDAVTVKVRTRGQHDHLRRRPGKKRRRDDHSGLAARQPIHCRRRGHHCDHRQFADGASGEPQSQGRHRDEQLQLAKRRGRAGGLTDGRGGRRSRPQPHPGRRQPTPTCQHSAFCPHAGGDRRPVVSPGNNLVSRRLFPRPRHR